ncbi:MAG TPA: NADH-quinone oxidoreductase subunit C [Candidatus Eremiobacteraeota bacterium]|nr:MAG: NADH-quinone oxidoreductase chain 5 [bacterium ADurb.Bin363]HPZ09628.1 NADH-quinone oxidoreductase subunit C [Candidatus Eremiobacteraeota bacterium]
MNREELVNKLKEVFSEDIKLNQESFDPIILVDSKNIINIMQELKENASLSFNYLMCLSGVDYPPEKIELVYHLFSIEQRHRLCVKTELPRENSVINSVVSLWKAAEWHEREIFDLLGVKFEGHTDLRRILLPEDFTGHPLKKDFSHPEVIPSPDKKEMMKPAKKT